MSLSEFYQIGGNDITEGGTGIVNLLCRYGRVWGLVIEVLFKEFFAPYKVFYI